MNQELLSSEPIGRSMNNSFHLVSLPATAPSLMKDVKEDDGVYLSGSGE